MENYDYVINQFDKMLGHCVGKSHLIFPHSRSSSTKVSDNERWMEL